MAARVVLAALALACGLGCAAQEEPSIVTSQSPQRAKEKQQTPSGTVTGTVYCADTNAPARLATVFLVPVDAGADKMLSLDGSAQTDLEGRFTMKHVPAGTYYVSADYEGYKNPLPPSRALFAGGSKGLSDEERKALDAVLKKVTVSSQQTASVSIRLERGAEIDGTVLYDDGSPAVGLHLVLHPKSEQKEDSPEANRLMDFTDAMDSRDRKTDDHGRYRILGVAPGEYTLGVEVPTGSADNPDNAFVNLVAMTPIGSLLVYHGDTTRASKAEVVKIDARDSSKDADITIPLSKLHTIRGRVIFKSTGEAPPTTALELVYADNREPARVAVATDGEFEIAYVPEGNYIVRAQGMNERLPSLDDDEGGGGGFLMQPSSLSMGGAGVRTDDPDKDFAGSEVSVTVAGDVSDLTIAVPDPPPAKPGSDPAAAQQAPSQP